jgi:DNA-binding transcriptional LysR family regulator
MEERLEPVYVRGRVNANNGEALLAAVAGGLGIALQPDFIVEPFLAAGTVEAILEPFAPPALGIHALLPGNRYVPYRVRVLIDFLASRLKQSDGQPGQHRSSHDRLP